MNILVDLHDGTSNQYQTAVQLERAFIQATDEGLCFVEQIKNNGSTIIILDRVNP